MIHYICTVFLRATKLQLNLISHWSCFKAQTEIVHIGFIDRPRSKVQAWWFWCLIQGSMIDWYIQRHAEAEQGLSFFRSIRMGIGMWTYIHTFPTESFTDGRLDPLNCISSTFKANWLDPVAKSNHKQSVVYPWWCDIFLEQSFPRPDRYNHQWWKELPSTCRSTYLLIFSPFIIVIFIVIFIIGI